MNTQRAIFKHKMSKVKKTSVFLLILFGVLGLAIFQDFLQSKYQSSAFYLSESFLFSTLWLLFFPIALVLRRLFRRNSFDQLSTWKIRILFVLTGVTVHVLLFALLVQVISATFHEFTFGFGRNLSYTLSADLYKYVLVYAAISLIPLSSKKEKNTRSETLGFQDAIWVSNGKKQEKIPVASILYIQSSTPYVEIGTDGKKYLHSATLKAMREILDPSQFVQIHKSTLINLKKVAELHSRLNGDYDVMLLSGQSFRLSRNFVSEFRKRQIKPTSA